ncbi:MAG: glycosyltransferase family 1 protein [Chloroflexi bacterium]|nr:glycosyltransferase family 1 protein [Chloroflexota bacterium]
MSALAARGHKAHTRGGPRIDTGSTTLTRTDPSNETAPSPSSASHRRRVRASTPASEAGAPGEKRNVKKRASGVGIDAASATAPSTDPVLAAPTLPATSPVTVTGGSDRSVPSAITRTRTRSGAGRRSETPTPKLEPLNSGRPDDHHQDTDGTTTTAILNWMPINQAGFAATATNGYQATEGSVNRESQLTRDHDMSRTHHSSATAQVGSRFNPGNLEVVLLSFEGPDQPYSMAGGLGVRVTELAQALAESGFRTHLIFVGDPNLPGHEVQFHGNLHLYRWSQWISRSHPNGVYDGEYLKVRDFNDSVPRFVADHIVGPAAAQGRTVAILAEEWHTAEATWRTSDLLYSVGLRNHALLLWNANNTFAFKQINWTRLSFVSTITTVSRYMKHLMWPLGLNALVIPNGIPDRFLAPPDHHLTEAIRQGVGGSPFLFKIGRFDPDKRWMQAVEAAVRLKRSGHRVRLVVRGGIEPHGGQVLAHAYRRGLVVKDVTAPRGDDWAAVRALSEASQDADVLNLRFFLSDDFKRACYGAADAVLANSGHEPFGIVGLEVMGAGGIAVVGATGEDYAISFQNCLAIETDDAEELAGAVRHLMAHPEWLGPIREEARRTAALFTWNRVIGNLLGKLDYLASKPR